MVDVIGGTLIVDDGSPFDPIIQAIEDSLPDGCEIARLKSSIDNKEGYRDIKVNLQFPNGGIGEIIVLSQYMNERKNNGGHNIYDVTRALEVYLENSNVNPVIKETANILSNLCNAFYDIGVDKDYFESIKSKASSSLTCLLSLDNSSLSTEDIALVKSLSSSLHSLKPYSVNSAALSNLSLTRNDINTSVDGVENTAIKSSNSVTQSSQNVKWGVETVANGIMRSKAPLPVSNEGVLKKAREIFPGLAIRGKKPSPHEVWVTLAIFVSVTLYGQQTPIRLGV